MNLISAMLVYFWAAGWMLAAVRAARKAKGEDGAEPVSRR